MISKNLIQQLQKRGLISQITDEKSLICCLKSEPISLYCGFDPTASSLHLGHLVPLLVLRHFQLAGYRPIVLLGGATGLIGDPSFKLTERKLNTIEITQAWSANLKRQVSRFLDLDCTNDACAVVVDNYEWFSTMNILIFLRDIGKHFSINQLISKEIIKKRLHRQGNSISFTEFSYNLMQSYDFFYLYQKYNVRLQIGGSDQWGNITSGIDLTRKLCQGRVYGLTMPLITKSDGSKFGKTEEGTIWLDCKKTSPYKFYQFWINTTDSDVYRYLKIFTFLSISSIEELEEKQSFFKDQSNRAQHILAEEVTRIVHGEQALLTAKRITSSLFQKTLTDLTRNDFDQLIKDGIPSIILKKDVDLQQALVSANLATSRRQARNMILSNAIEVNGNKATTPEYCFKSVDRLYGCYTLLRKGKKHYSLIQWDQKL